MTKPTNAGISLAEGIIKMVHLMYQNEHAHQFLTALIEKLMEELNRRPEK